MKDIIESLKIRFNNPFLISFVISWPFWNWPITTAFIKYNAETLHKYTGCDNFIELINHYWNVTDSLVLPTGSALLYIILAPLVKYVISSYTAFVTAREEARLLKISSKHPVSFEVYYDLISKSHEKEKKMAEVAEQELTAKKENIELKSTISNLNIEKEELSSKLNAETSKTQSLNKALDEARNDAKKWNDQYSKVNANLSNSLKEANDLRNENFQLRISNEEKKQLYAEVDNLKTSFKSIVKSFVSSKKPGTYSGRKLIQDIHQLPISDNSLKYQLSDIVEHETRVPYKIKVKLKDGFSHTSITDTFSPTHPMETIETDGNDMTFIIEFDFEYDIKDFLKTLREWNIMEEVTLLEGGRQD